MTCGVVEPPPRKLGRGRPPTIMSAYGTVIVNEVYFSFLVFEEERSSSRRSKRWPGGPKDKNINPMKKAKFSQKSLIFTILPLFISFLLVLLPYSYNDGVGGLSYNMTLLIVLYPISM